MLAGHIFQETEDGRCSCGKKFIDIAWAAETDVGKYDIAHSGQLTANELDQIIAERERIWRLVQGSAQGGVVLPDPEPTEDPQPDYGC